MAKKMPANLDNLDGSASSATAVAEVETIAPPAPKMEMATLPAGAKTPPAVAPTVPGTFAPAAVSVLPPMQKKHYLDVFPNMRPREAGPSAPGVWLNPDGTVYTPRQREGGQFSLLHIEFQNKWRPELTRVAVMPLKQMQEDDYGTQTTETIISRTEVIFDFQDQMQECLAAFGKKIDPLADHLQKRLREQGVAAGVGFDVPLKYASR